MGQYGVNDHPYHASQFRIDEYSINKTHGFSDEIIFRLPVPIFSTSGLWVGTGNRKIALVQAELYKPSKDLIKALGGVDLSKYHKIKIRLL